MPIKAMLRAKYDYQGAEEEELSFKEGDTIYLLYKDDSGWAKGRKGNGEKGWFPFDFAEVVVDVEKQDEAKDSLIPSNAIKPEENSSTADKAAEEKVSEQDKGRFQIVKEITVTERTYYRHLITIVKAWMTPLRDGSIIDPKFLPKIFCNVENIIPVNSTLLAELEGALAKWSESQTVGDIFLRVLPEFAVYTEYLKNHHAAILTVNQFTREKKAFANWIQNVKDYKECGGLDLLAFLIMPVQRILRYKLLLEELIKSTPLNHIDYKNLKDALKKVTEIALNVNESIREEENFQKLCRIQKSFAGNVKNIVADGRKFIREGPVMKICRKTDKPRWFFLFSDVLVYASVTGASKKQSNSGTVGRNNVAAASTKLTNPNANQLQQKYLFHRMVSLKTTTVKDAEDTATLKNAFQIITAEEKSFTVYTESPEQKREWMKDLLEVTAKHEDLDTSAPVWVPDNETKTCQICNKSFNMVQRRHHCRHCGKVVCGACSANKIKIAHLGSKPVRICKICNDEWNKGTLSPKDAAKSARSSSAFLPKDIPPEIGKEPAKESSKETIKEAPKESPTASPKESPKQSPLPSPRTSVESKTGETTNGQTNKVPVLEEPTPIKQQPPLPQPSKPIQPKPAVKPRASTTDSELLRKKVEDLEKLLEMERAERLEMEKTLRQELDEQKEAMKNLLQKLQPILNPPVRRPPTAPSSPGSNNQ